MGIVSSVFYSGSMFITYTELAYTSTIPESYPDEEKYSRWMDWLIDWLIDLSGSPRIDHAKSAKTAKVGGRRIWLKSLS